MYFRRHHNRFISSPTTNTKAQALFPLPLFLSLSFLFLFLARVRERSRCTFFCPQQGNLAEHTSYPLIVAAA
ncbi:hypothetical protein P167DRAFT_539568 [Morchella conica CCBAS932]|uniref:Uncharacterized protein n=1 Tax=Morchella conica CCBAS932 TaxID=1392247 RepID=A0A3N4KI57_9PEZI|nr:hypothetical protein P167DRAFT_539568 [Morchella conica CCBAS932]